VNGRQAAGFTPLHEAAGNGDVELGHLLLQAGADSTERGHDAILALLG